MRPAAVGVLSVVFDHDPGLGQGPELLAVEALVAEASVEGFHERPVEKPLEVARNLQHCRA